MSYIYEIAIAENIAASYDKERLEKYSRQHFFLISNFLILSIGFYYWFPEIFLKKIIIFSMSIVFLILLVLSYDRLRKIRKEAVMDWKQPIDELFRTYVLLISNNYTFQSDNKNLKENSFSYNTEKKKFIDNKGTIDFSEKIPESIKTDVIQIKETELDNMIELEKLEAIYLNAYNSFSDNVSMNKLQYEFYHNEFVLQDMIIVVSEDLKSDDLNIKF